MDRKDLAKELVTIASAMVEVEERGAKQATQSPEAVLRDVREAQMLVASISGVKLKMAAAPRTSIKEIPGFSPQQLRTAIDQIVKVRQKSTALRTQFEAQLKQIKDLDDQEKKGLAALKAAASQMKQKERFLVEAETGLLEFTAFLQDKRPGVEQMLADPETSKFGDKAGDFFGRVGARLGKKVQDTIAEIYSETEDDLTHTADAIRGLKIVAKTASINASTMKKAGVTDVVISLKEWLTGKVDGAVKRILNFGGDIKRWVKGFVERTKVVKSNTNDLTKALDDAKDSINSALA
jgi:ABC-type transporter Mla subunit MlaD